jgi:hypothetical protein
MISKGLAMLVMLLAMVQAPAPALAQADNHPATTPQSSPYAAGQSKADCNGVPCEEQQPLRIIAVPPPAPATWPIHERIKWAAFLVLAIVGYVGVILSVSTLKKIERHIRASEESSAAAAETAQAALLYAQAYAHAERPWILVTAEPTRGVDNSFEIAATNRGRSPATISAASDRVLFAPDEARLSAGSELKRVDSGSRFVPIILLPGESATLKTFSREEVKDLCASDEKFARVELWEERIFLCGKITYSDLATPAGTEAHETNWCLWYIHGKQRSALVPSGSSAYNSHT